MKIEQTKKNCKKKREKQKKTIKGTFQGEVMIKKEMEINK